MVGPKAWLKFFGFKNLDTLCYGAWPNYGGFVYFSFHTIKPMSYSHYFPYASKLRGALLWCTCFVIGDLAYVKGVLKLGIFPYVHIFCTLNYFVISM